MRRFYFIAIFFSGISSILSQSESECGGAIMCPVGTPCNATEESIRCTENAVCDPVTSVCTCNPGFMRTSYDYCLPSYQTNCSLDQCNEEANLICDSETNLCKCALGGTHFSIPQQKCVSNAETPCSQIFGCTDNAYCNNELDWYCYCKGGFSPTVKGRCLLGVDRICNSSVGQEDEHAYLHACNADVFLVCEKEKCTCPAGTVYDEDIEQCVSLVDGKCDFKVTIHTEKVLKCVRGAACRDNGQYGICKCARQSNLNKDAMTCDNGVGHAFTQSVKITIFIAFLFTILSFESTK